MRPADVRRPCLPCSAVAAQCWSRQRSPVAQRRCAHRRTPAAGGRSRSESQSLRECTGRHTFLLPGAAVRGRRNPRRSHCQRHPGRVRPCCKRLDRPFRERDGSAGPRRKPGADWQRGPLPSRASTRAGTGRSATGLQDLTSWRPAAWKPRPATPRSPLARLSSWRSLTPPAQALARVPLAGVDRENAVTGTAPASEKTLRCAIRPRSRRQS